MNLIYFIKNRADKEEVKENITNSEGVESNLEKAKLIDIKNKEKLNEKKPHEINNTLLKNINEPKTKMPENCNEVKQVQEANKVNYTQDDSIKNRN